MDRSAPVSDQIDFISAFKNPEDGYDALLECVTPCRLLNQTPQALLAF